MSLGNPYGAMARCVMNADKTIAYFLDPTNSNNKLDGTPVDWSDVELNVQNVMVQIPKFYYCKKWDSGNSAFYFGVSNTKKDTQYVAANEWVLHPAFMKDQTKAYNDSTSVAVEVPYRYCGAFQGWVDGSNRMRSLPNKSVTTGLNFPTMATYAGNMGLGYCEFDYYLYNALQWLYLTEYGHPNSKLKLGYGPMPTEDAAKISGSTLIYGNSSYGNKSSYTDTLSYRGVENLYSAFPTFLDGCYCFRAYSDKSVHYLASYYTLSGSRGYTSLGSEFHSYDLTANAYFIRNIPKTNCAFIGETASSFSSLESGMYSGQMIPTIEDTAICICTLTYSGDSTKYAGIMGLAISNGIWNSATTGYLFANGTYGASPSGCRLAL